MQTVAIKGGKDGLLISLNETEEWQSVMADLASRIDQQNSFFVGARITLDYRRAGLSEKQMAMLDFAVKLTLDPVTCSEEDVDELRGLGFSDEDVWDIAEVTAMFNFTNRLASATGMMPNPEYHAMAR